MCTARALDVICLYGQPCYYYVVRGKSTLVCVEADIFECLREMKRCGAGARLYKNCGTLLAYMQRGKET